MRRIQRPAVALPTLASGAGAIKAARHLADRARDPGAALGFPDHWNEPDVRGALYAMHGRVCAFCLSELTRSDRGDVEHFRPKSLYFWLAYTFENYLLACGKCNRIWKRERFPIAPGAARVTFDTRIDLPREARLFLDPVDDPVDEWLLIRFDDGFLRWAPSPSLAPGSHALSRVEETRDHFHWNDDPDLVKPRTDAVDEALCALDTGDVAEARRLASRFRPHGGAVRSVLQSLGWIELPSADEELRWLLEDLREEWQDARAIGGPLSDKKLVELSWAFAVLWKAPPLGARLDVAVWLADAGLRSDVEPSYRRL